MCSLVTKINDERKLLDRLPLAARLHNNANRQTSLEIIGS